MVISLTPGQRERQVAGLAAALDLARFSFRDFLPFVRIKETGVGTSPLQVWPHIAKVVDVLESEQLIAVPKSRQIGMTTVLAAYALWHAMFVPNALVLAISKGEREAHDFLGKSKDIYSLLPGPLQLPRGLPDNQERMTFSNGGRIMALPSTEDAGRGLTPTLVIMDEADYHEYLEAAYNSVKPGLGDNRGQLILTSTISAYKIGSLFQDICCNAPDNGFVAYYFGWRSRPNRDDTWYTAERATYRDKALFQKEHSETWEEAFAPASAIAAFDGTVLARMRTHTRDPIEQPTLGNGVRANIYQAFQPGQRYTAGTDTSHGTGRDYAVTLIINVVTGYVVADIYSNVLNPSELAIASVELLNMYDSPIWAIEDNDWGAITITRAQDLHYKRLYWRDETHIGWHTYESAGMSSGSRYLLWGDLIDTVNSQFFTIPNAEGLAQFLTVIRNPAPGKHGRIEAQQGAHDDYPMALGIAWQIRQKAHLAAGERGRPFEWAAPRRPSNGRYAW